MKKNILGKIMNEIREDKAKRRRMRTFALVLSLFVATGVVWQLKLTGITMTGEALCNHLEHQHTEECLGMVNACGLEESDGHEHGTGCYSRTLTCTQELHEHGDGCYTASETPVCGKEASEGHHHDDATCFPKTQTCTLDVHEHGDGCYTVSETPVCGQEESEEHPHDATECYRTFTCTAQAHTHGDGCYTVPETPACGLEESEGHQHDAAECYRTFTCTAEAHAHGDACYTVGETLECGKEVGEGHKHTDECLRESYICGQEVHKHTLLCYSDINADLETSYDWELTIPALTLDKDVDLASVARSQLGYTESERNYKVASDEVTKLGYTRYGEWYGNPYGDWNAMFASFCLHYSDSPAYAALKSSGAESMRVNARSAGYYAESGTVPYVGDLAFLDKDGNGSCDSVGIVAGRYDGGMNVIEGDCGGKVAENAYSLNNGTVMGYAALSKPHSQQPPLMKSPAKSQTEGAGQITLTFVINNANYTNDPGNNTTHLTVASTDGLATDGGLTYSEWPGQSVYKVGGTGTLATLTITSGTSVSGSGMDFPKVDVTNMSPEVDRTYSYNSVYSWVNDQGMICTANTVFTENTTLYLSLTESGKSCTLNWVCNCDNGGNHSITFYVSGFGSPTFTWGQSIPAENIPTAEAINSNYHSQYCSAGPDNGLEFKGWFLKDSSGNEIDFGPGVPILEDYKDPNSSGYTVKVYARWGVKETPVEVTATFVNGETQTTATLTAGSALGDKLPAVTAPEGKIFLGWRIENSTDYATAETVIETDTTYTAVFANEITVTFVNGETTVETRKLAENAPLGELPAAPEAAENMAFLGWQAEGMEGYATAEMTVTAPLTFHARFATNVTLTFMNNGTQFGDTVKVPQGASVWEYLPQEEPEYTGDSESSMAFSGWQINGTEDLVTEETKADTDMTLTAVFEEVEGFDVYLHDIAPDGVTDYEKDGQDVLISQAYLQVGTTLAEELQSNPVYMKHDGVSAASCKWYIKQVVDGTETYVPYDLSTEVTSELHLYTFHYTVTLTRADATATASLDPYGIAPASVDISQDGRTLTLTLREGERPSAADFVVDGVDYTLYSWTYTDENGHTKTLNIADILANGVDKNITATSNGNLKLTTTEINANFFVSINGEWKNIKATQITSYVSGGRYHLSGAQLESVYGSYGFDAADLSDSGYLFAHTDVGGGNIWACSPTQLNTDSWFIPGLGHSGTVDIYYLPNKTITTAGSGFSKTDSVTHNGHDVRNTFYMIRVSDPMGSLYDKDELPGVKYVLTGNSCSVTLRYDPDIPWMLNGNEIGTDGGPGYTVSVNDAEGTITVTFASVTESKSLVLGNYLSLDINYNVNLTGTPANTAPTINGKNEYSETVVIQGDGTYTVLTPSRTEYSIKNALDSAWDTYEFQGWSVNGSTELLAPGTVLTKDQIAQYGGSLNLTGSWRMRDRSNTVSFYVNRTLGEIGGERDNFTKTVFGTVLTYEPTSMQFSYGQTPYDGEADPAAADAVLRSFVDGEEIDVPVGTNGTEKVTFTVTAFPNDEEVLGPIRNEQAQAIKAFENSGLTLEEYNSQSGSKIICDLDANGNIRYVPKDELTSENYTIRWYRLKYHDNKDLYSGHDGWHVDGILVKKHGMLTVTKTFYGDEAAIEAVKDGNYRITVQESGTGGATVNTLNLNPKSDTNADGYTNHVEATDTYTWVIPLTAGKSYVIKEDGHIYAEGNITTLAEYGIVNPVQGSTPTNGRVTYTDSGVTVKVKGYNADAPYTSYQTVQFFNSYLSTESLTISKVDDSGASLPGVSFRLYKNVNGTQTPQNIWLGSDGVYYTNPDIAPEGAQQVPSGYITVDSQGYADVVGLDNSSTYSLAEEVTPTGYISVDPIVITVDATGGITLAQNDAAELLGGGAGLRVTNTSVTMDVTAVKKWLDGTNLPVKVQLTLDGTPLTGYDELTLNADNNWTATWEDVPAYIGGQLANYSVKETWIGDTAYNGSFADGYNDYLVNVEQPTYTYDENDLPTAATVTVTNQTHLGGLTFIKVDEKGVGLPGALFALYTEECAHMGSGTPCEHIYGDPARSDLHGNVNFGNLAPGTYFMSEVQAPAGYQDNDTVYQVTVHGTGTNLTVKGSDTPISRITNITATANLQIKKVDGLGNPLTGAIFKVYMYNGTEWVPVATNGDTEYTVEDSSGMLIVPNLLPGDYKLVEISAPAGYYRMTEEVEFNVALAKIVARDVLDDQGNEVPGANSWSFDGETITVVNVLGSELPVTGGMGTHFGTMAGLLMMAASLLYGFLLRRKREGRGAF